MKELHYARYRFGNIQESMNNETQFVLRCEEVFHDKISAAAATILSSNRPIVALTGPSGSGKTTSAMRLKDYLENLGVTVCLLSMDNFSCRWISGRRRLPIGSPPTA